ncbi:hypothetical protein [Actinomycetospora termitidis]|nr:hypothetical protein [Actinomycetospora sp. Odt1-22]
MGWSTRTREGDKPANVARRSRESREAHGAHCRCVTCKNEPMPGRR